MSARGGGGGTGTPKAHEVSKGGFVITAFQYRLLTYFVEEFEEVVLVVELLPSRLPLQARPSPLLSGG